MQESRCKQDSLRAKQARTGMISIPVIGWFRNLSMESKEEKKSSLLIGREKEKSRYNEGHDLMLMCGGVKVTTCTLLLVKVCKR